MNALVEFIHTLIDAIVASPGMTKAQAINVIQLATNDITNEQAATWLDDIAQVWETIGVINNPTWSAWRNEIEKEGADAPKALVVLAAVKLHELPQLADVNDALQFKKQEDTLAELIQGIQTARAFRDKQTDDVIVETLNRGINSLRNQRDGLKGRLGV
jgi:hypothetical protein